jgi:hypothetical protein
MLQRIGLLLVALLVCVAAAADIVDELSSYTGYTIVGTKTVIGYRDKNGKRSDDFEGCDFDRTIKFDDGTVLTCSSYSYTYAYRPTALILMKTNEYQGRKFASVVMIVEDEAYEMAPVLLH